MTADHPVRRILARLCSAETMARIVDPTLADMAWERGRPPWLGYLALARALALHGLFALPRVAARVWSDDGHAIPKAAVLAFAIALTAGIALVALSLSRLARPGLAIAPIGFLLLPGTLVVTLPAALLVAIPVALKNQAPRPRLMRRTLAFSVCSAAVTFVLCAWVVPNANQSFRVAVTANSTLPRGASESGFAAMRQRIEDVRSMRGGGPMMTRRLEYAYYGRWAISFAPIAGGLLALAVALSRAGRKHPLRTGMAAAAIYLLTIPWMYPTGAMLIRFSTAPPFLIAWAPTLAVVAAAAILWRFARPVAP
jgi:hypothetical protein